MPSPYSLDLRERAVAAAMAGEQSRAVIARQFAVSEPTLYEWLRRYRETGSVIPKPHGGGQPRRLDAAGDALLRDLVRTANDRTLDEYRAQLLRAGGPRLGRSTLAEALARLKLPRKKSPSGRVSRTGPTSWPSGPPSARG
jgi:transposase